MIWIIVIVHVFDVSGLPNIAPKQVANIPLTRQMTGTEAAPCAYSCQREGWLQHSRDGRFVYVGDSGDVIDTATRQSIANLSALYNSRKHIEIDWANGAPVFATTRHGVGYVTSTNLGAVLRWTDSNNWYKAYIDGSQLVMQNRVNGSYSTLASTSFAAVGGTSYSLRFRIVGTHLYANVWQAGSPEPTGWMLTATDSALQSGFCGLRMQMQSGVTASVTSFLATTV